MEKNFHLGAKAIIRNTSGKILLLSSHSKGKQYWDLPGGRVQLGEEVQTTLHREVLEETGIKLNKNITHLHTFLTPIQIPLDASSEVGLILSVYLCSLEGEQDVSLSDEHTTYEWVPCSEVYEFLGRLYPQNLLPE